MTERFDLEKAVKIVGLNIHAESADEGRDFDVACRMIISALEEIQQYRAIGTVEECRTAVERMKPRKALTYKRTNRANCPNCGATIRGIDKPFGDFCSKCGQAIGWQE